ncbi:restriction endonuclease subunit S [Agrobacterium tumefaciens]|uniref:restriction endonuclease subunit S n=1 Tax=Agrobacterium tumefaciens TaxID=358 RepID=UPI0021CDF036|nr:restriction endonuclease subunit S [Agrobacterium tumefaciens]UXS26465.1 restriction endonuclease subunit S [Agrobacterium tumefaciens]UXS55037.1 restriction endonuclease subunit S [Agrobacterium tumefaciens]UXS64991.1 restriction endonuclease subunit S [Agrobacterium tumefaciens]
MTWARVPLSELSETIDYGVTASANPTSGKAKFLRITDIQENGVNWATVPFCDADAKKLRNARLVDGDIVFARTGATTGKSFLVRRPPEDAVFASYLIRVRATESATPEYLAHFFDTRDYWSQIKGMAQGAAQEGVNASKLASLQIPLPPLYEQKRIAAILDKADALRAKRRQAIALLESLAQSIFLETFGDHAIKVRLGDICTRITDGTHQAPKWAADGVPFLFVSNIRNQAISLETEKYVSHEEYARLTKNCPIEPGDVLYTAVGSYGNAAVVPADQTFVFQRHIAQIKPQREQISPVFLSLALESPAVRQQADRVARGVAQKTVTLASLREFEIPLPKIEEQKAFEAKILKIRQLMMSNQLHSLGYLFASLQHRAFTGQL